MVDLNTIAACYLGNLSIHLLKKNYQVGSCWGYRNRLVHYAFFIRQLICWNYSGSINVSWLVDESGGDSRLSLDFCGLFFVVAPPDLIRFKCDNPSPEGLESSRTSNGLKQKAVRHPVGSR